MKVLSKIALLTVVLSALTACSMGADSSGGSSYGYLFDMIPGSTGTNPIYQPNPDYGKNDDYRVSEFLLYNCPVSSESTYELTEDELITYSEYSYYTPKEMYEEGYNFASGWFSGNFRKPASMHYIYSYREVSATKGYLYFVPVKYVTWGVRYNGEDYVFKEYETEADHKVLIYEYEYKGMPHGYYPDYEYKKVIQDDLKTATLLNIDRELFYNENGMYFSLNKMSLLDNDCNYLFTTEYVHWVDDIVEYSGLNCKNLVIKDKKDSKEFDFHVIGKGITEEDIGDYRYSKEVPILLKLKIKYSDIRTHLEYDSEYPYCDITIVSVENDNDVEVFSPKNKEAQDSIDYYYREYEEFITETVNCVKEAFVGKKLRLDKYYW